MRAAEDLLSLSRSLKEAWLFGKLNTSKGRDGSDDDDGVEEDAKEVGEMIGRLFKVQETL